MNKIRALVREFDDLSLKQLVEQYEQFEQDGFIGDCSLRTEAEKFGESVGAADHVVTWMDRIAYESYRELYLRTEM